MRFLTAAILGCFFPILIFSQQTATLRGFVYDKGNGEPVPSVNIQLKGTKIHVMTDVNGFYSISGLQPGAYNLVASFIGFDTVRITVNLKAGEIINKKIMLTESVTMLGDAEITASKEQKTKEVNISIIPVTVEDINRVPSVGGEPDIAQYLQILPGVNFTGDQGGQLYIRGGTPVQNKVILDGMTVYNPFHSIGLFSVFDADIIRSADVYTGGFNAKFGGRISSIMDITTRDGNKKRFAGKVSASPFIGKALIEGPWKKLSDEGSSSSYLLSLKSSYLDRSSKLFYSYIDKEGLPYNFLDIYGKTSFNSANGSKLNMYGFTFNDHVKYQHITDIRWGALGGGTNFVLIPNNSPLLIEGAVAYSDYAISMTEADSLPRSSKIKGFNMGTDFSYFRGNNEIKYGVEINYFTTDFDYYNSVRRHIEQKENTTELAGFVKGKVITRNKKFIMEPSLRLHYYAALRDFSPEPRLGFKFNVTDKFRTKFAGGFYSQNLLSATSDRDVVNLFYGFLSGSDNLQDEFVNENGETVPVRHHLQKAWHAIGGFEVDLHKRLDLNVEFYWKQFTQLTNINRSKLFDDDEQHADIIDALKKDFIIETGNAKGIDFLLKYDYKRLYIWAVYSLGFVDRWDGIIHYTPHFDRRHNVNLVVAYQWGKDRDWEVDARWNYGSGFPFTQTAGFYENLVFSNGINTNYTNTNYDPANPQSNSQLGILYGDLNAARLPYYHRLDVAIKKKFVISENSTIEASAGATNCYNRENIFYFDRIHFTRVNQLPILPSISMNWSF